MAPEKLVRQLVIVLNEERQHLLSGDLGRLPRLAKRKEQLITALAAQHLPHETLTRLANLSEHNQSLFNAAREGLVSALARLAELQRGAPMGIYSRLGEKTEYTKPIRTLHRRA